MTDIKQRIREHKVLVVVPTYNNAGTIASVVESVQQFSDDLLVVNDGSTDETLPILESLKINHISYLPNRGKGYAIKQAFRYALENGYDYVLTMDSDGQHYASDIEKFVAQIDVNPDSLIIGARNLRADNMPAKNTFANKFSNFWYLVETGKRLDDTQSGFRLYPLKKIGRMHFLTRRYEFEVEVIVRAAWKGVNVFNIPIGVYYPAPEERVSHFKPLKDFTRISILNSHLVIIALLYYYPLLFFRYLTKKNIEKFVKEHITETKSSNNHIAASIGLGVFFGIAPIWGYQMIVAGLTAHLLKLNKVLTLVSSNISIPPIIPFILYGSFYAGGIVLGCDVDLDFSSITYDRVRQDLVQYLYGALVFAFICGLAAYFMTFVSLVLFRRKTNG